MHVVTVDEFVAGLRTIPEAEFSVGTVYDYVQNHSVREQSLHPFLFFSKSHYTRNLIFKNDLFELLAICWEVGQASLIHNHYDQNCWMAMPIGRLRVQNFRILEQHGHTGYCRLEPTDAVDIHRLLSAEVDPSEPLHQVLNLPEFNKRAVSLHIYSRPFNRCLVYSQEKNHCQEIQLHYSSVYGKLCPGVTL